MAKQFDFVAAGRKGGLSKQKQAGGRPKGVRVNKLGMTEHEYRGLLADLAASIRKPIRGIKSIRACADFCHVSDRTVRRWLDGTDWASSDKVRCLQRWLRAVTTETEA